MTRSPISETSLDEEVASTAPLFFSDELSPTEPFSTQLADVHRRMGEAFRDGFVLTTPLRMRTKWRHEAESNHYGRYGSVSFLKGAFSGYLVDLAFAGGMLVAAYELGQYLSRL